MTRERDELTALSLGTASARIKPVAKSLERQVRYATPANEPVFAQPKEGVIEHEGYKRLVPAAMCALRHRGLHPVLPC